MKNIFLVFAICLSAFRLHSQKTVADSISQIIIKENIIEKVGQHDKIVERFETLSPGFWAISGVAVLGILWTLWLYFYGFKKRLDDLLKDEKTITQIEILIRERKEAIEKAEATAIKSKAIHILFPKGTNFGGLTSHLESHGFTNVIPHNFGEKFDIKTNELVVFNNEDGSLKNDVTNFVTNPDNKWLSQKARFFFYTNSSQEGRWEDQTFPMVNFATNRAALPQRLFEALK